MIANTWSGLTVCSRDSVEIAPVLGLWCAGTQMARWQRDGLDKSEARADAPCGGVAVAGSSTTMRRRETLRWRWRPDRMTVRWRRAAQMLGPLLGRVAIHSWRQRRDGVEFVGSSRKTNGGDASTSAKSDRDGDGIRDDEGARVPAGGRTRGDIGLGGCARNITREGLAVPPKPPPNSVSAVFPKLPP